MQEPTNPSGETFSGAATGRTFMSRTTQAASGAAKVFREFKWGLLTLFLLMVVVISLIYDGGDRVGKKDAGQPETAQTDPKQPAAPEAPAHETTLIDQEDRPPHHSGGGGNVLEPAPYRAEPRVTETSPYRDEPAPPAPERRAARTVNPPLPSGVPEFRDQRPPQWISSPQYSQVGNRLPGHLSGQRTAETTRIVSGTPPSGLLPSNPPPVQVRANTYKVEPGDTLSGIAMKFYPGRVQSGTRLLATANKHLFSDPRRMQVGMTLRIPNHPQPAPSSTIAADSHAGAAVGQTSRANKSDASTSSFYTVKAGDNLQRIAIKLFDDSRLWQKIYEWNKDRLQNPSHLRVGQKLRVRHLQTDTKPSKPAATKSGRRVVVRQKETVDRPTAVIQQTTDFTPVWMP